MTVKLRKRWIGGKENRRNGRPRGIADSLNDGGEEKPAAFDHERIVRHVEDSMDTITCVS